MSESPADYNTDLDVDALLDERLGLTELERVLNLSRMTIRRMVNEGKFPQPERIRGIERLTWRKRPVAAWVAENFTEGFGEPKPGLVRKPRKEAA